MENKVELLGFYGGDKRHCLSAWQSTTEELGIELPPNIEDRIDVIFEHIAKTKKKSPWDLLQFLADNQHETPFEKSFLDFQIVGDVASHIHQIKHRIGISVNSESARYKEFVKSKYYIPNDWKDQESDDRSSLGNDIADDILYQSDYNWAKALEIFNDVAITLYHSCCDSLTKTLGRKRAKESSRYFLPYATQLNYDAAFNFRSFMHFQNLRNSEHAQKEICWIAQEMLRLVKEIPGEPFKYSLQAFGY